MGLFEGVEFVILFVKNFLILCFIVVVVFLILVWFIFGVFINKDFIKIVGIFLEVFVKIEKFVFFVFWLGIILLLKILFNLLLIVWVSLVFVLGVCL